MTISDLLQNAKIPSLESECIVAHVFEKNRVWTLAHGDECVSEDRCNHYRTLEHRVLTGEPLAYVLGHHEFYGRTFTVTPDTLIPRASTEELVRETLRFLETGDEAVTEPDTNISILSKKFGPLSDVHTVVDVGTGSGCVGITLLCEQPKLLLVATDISEKALLVAWDNAVRHSVDNRSRMTIGNALEPVEDIEEPFLLVSNPPYIPSSLELDASVQDFEPHSALFAGEDGMDVLRVLVSQAKSHPQCRGFVLECRSDQVQEILHGST